MRDYERINEIIARMPDTEEFIVRRPREYPSQLRYMMLVPWFDSAHLGLTALQIKIAIALARSTYTRA